MTAFSLREKIDLRIESAAPRYERERDLPKLLSRDKWADKSDAEIQAMLLRAINAGSKAIAAGRWHASPGRQMALRMAYAGEQYRQRPLNVGEPVTYHSNFGRGQPADGVITGTGEEAGVTVYDVRLHNGDTRWGYREQFEVIG